MKLINLTVNKEIPGTGRKRIYYEARYGIYNKHVLISEFTIIAKSVPFKVKNTKYRSMNTLLKDIKL